MIAWPGLPKHTRFLYYVIQYAIENEIREVTEQELDECVEGMYDELVSWYIERVFGEELLDRMLLAINESLNIYYKLFAGFEIKPKVFNFITDYSKFHVMFRDGTEIKIPEQFVKDHLYLKVHTGCYISIAEAYAKAEGIDKQVQGVTFARKEVK